MIFNKTIDWGLFFLPMAAITITSNICKIGKDAGSNVKFRPPPATFGIVWFILSLLIGLSWVVCVDYDRNSPSTSSAKLNGQTLVTYCIYTLLTLSLMMWIIFYGCGKDKLKALWTFIPTLMLCFMVQSIGNVVSKLLICPLIAWIIFALLLGTQDLQSAGLPARGVNTTAVS